MTLPTVTVEHGEYDARYLVGDDTRYSLPGPMRHLAPGAYSLLPHDVPDELRERLIEAVRKTIYAEHAVDAVLAELTRTEEP